MLVQLLANMAIILVDFYILIKINGGLLSQKTLDFKNWLRYVSIQTFVGTIMLLTAPRILGVLMDFRVILYIMMMRYMGPKITLPTILLVGIGRLFVETNTSIPTNIVFTAVLMATLPFLSKWAGRRFSEFTQVIVINYIYLLMVLPIYMYVLRSWSDALYVFGVVLLSSSVFVTVIRYVSNDVQKLFDLAVMDNLSNLYNARQLQEDLVRLSQDAGGYALVIIDIDDFKMFNDQFGHLVGDEVIRKFSEVLKQAVGQEYKVYRYGGEEFVVIVKDVQGKIAYQVAIDISEKIRNLTIPCEQNGLQHLTVTASIGISYQWKGEQLLNTFRRADQAMYTAKVSGKDQIVIG